MTPEWSTACLDWEQRIVAGKSLVPFDPLFPAEAEAALDIFRDLILVDVANKPTMGEACLPWAFELPRALFGSYDAESGRRLIRFYFEFVAKKNSKSTRAAGIMLTALLRNWRESGEFYILAPTKEIADNSFFPARDMVRADENLRSLLHVQDNFRTITHRNTGAFLKVVAADSNTVGGKKTIGLLVDELWQFGAKSDADAMLREAAGGLLSRPEGFVIYLSTQSDTEPAGVFKQRLEEFRAVRDGVIVDKRTLPILHEFPKHLLDSGEYRQRRWWYITNPNLGKSVDEETIADELTRAERAGRRELVNAEAKFLNVQVGLASFNWVGADYWLDAVNEDITLDYIVEHCDTAVAGVDGGGLDDLYGLAIIGRHRVTREWIGWTHAWAQTDVFERRKEIADRLRDFAKQGDLTICEDATQDIREIADIIASVRDAGLLPKENAIGLDPLGVSALVDELAARGIGEPQVRAIGQGYQLAPAVWGLERKLKDGTFWHGGRPMMAWCVGNAKTEQRGNAVLITKQQAGKAKIDPLVALFDAVILMSRNPSARSMSVFEALARGEGQSVDVPPIAARGRELALADADDEDF